MNSRNSMNSGRGNSFNTSRGVGNGLESVRARFGEQRALETFAQAAQRSKAQAAAMVNDPSLRFRTLFVLIPHIKAYGVYNDLNERARIALKLCADMLRDDELKKVAVQTRPDNQTEADVLKWMLRTGTQDDGSDNRYAKTLDNAAGLITDRYHDATVLPHLVDLLFRRAREGYNIHDLSWVLFHGGDPHMLRLAAGYLRSAQPKDYELACALLHLEPLPEQERAQGRQKQYQSYVAWLSENYDYLYPTEESFQLKSDPQPFAVDMGAKYLVRPTLLRDPATAVQAIAVSGADRLPNEFLTLSEQEKELLAGYSNKLYKRNRTDWNRFIAQPVSAQLSEAKQAAQTEGSR